MVLQEKAPPPVVVGLPVIGWRAGSSGGAGAAAPMFEGGGVERLPPSGWIHFCTQCTRPTSQRLLIITCRRGGEMHSIVICRPCMGGAYPRFSEHICYAVRLEHLRAPLPDVNEQADRILAEYAKAQAEKRAAEAQEANCSRASEKKGKRCCLQ